MKKVSKKPLKKLPKSLKGKCTLAQLNRARKLGRTISIAKGFKKQVGRSAKDLDKGKQALAPGKRLTPWGTIYYETRRNRADTRGRKL